MKKLALAAFLFISMAALTGCGGEYQKAGEGADNAVTQGAVSGAAVEAEKIPVKYTNRNSTNLYTTPVDEYHKTIEQRSLDGKLIKKLKPDARGADIISMRYVDDEWMYYTRWKEKEGESIELWRVPIQKTDGCDEVQFEQEEKVLVSEHGIFDTIYVADDFVYYNEASAPAQEGTCRKYDIKNGRQVTLTMPDGGQVPEGAGSLWYGWCEGSMFLTRDAELTADGKAGLYVLDTHTDQFRLLQGEDYLESFVANQKQAYYLQGNEVKRYCSGMEQAETYITEEQLVKAEEAAGYHASLPLEICELYLDDTTLYILAAEKERQFPDLLFSCKVQGKCNVKFEDILFGCVEDGCFKGEFDVLHIVDGKCLIRYSWVDSNDNCYCFDLDSPSSLRKVTKKDAEYWWRYW